MALNVKWGDCLIFNGAFTLDVKSVLNIKSRSHPRWLKWVIA